VGRARRADGPGVRRPAAPESPRRSSRIRRSRAAGAVALLATVALGLASRQPLAAALPRGVAVYAGDTLWAAMVFWLLGLLRPRGRTAVLAGAALALCAAVEVSQLYHAPWLDAARATRLGALAFGQGFVATDLLCYAAGVAGAALVDRALVRRGPRRGAEAHGARAAGASRDA
jgi:hypothetical protein